MTQFYDKLVLTVPDGLDDAVLAAARRKAQDAYVDALAVHLAADLALADTAATVHIHDPVTGHTHDETLRAHKARRATRD